MTSLTQLLKHSVVSKKPISESVYTSLLDEQEKLFLPIQNMAKKAQYLHFKNQVYIRGLIEISNYCNNDCDYCGIRCSNKAVQRFRLSDEDILTCCKKGYALGFKTFVLQGGEDLLFDVDRVSKLIRQIKKEFSDCALTLSLGEKPAEVYAEWKKEGADRYLLRHESANSNHYAFLHQSPVDQKRGRTAIYRQNCLYTLKKLGYQTGAGFMVGTPLQTNQHVVEDLLFLQDLQPEMIGIGPYIPHPETPLGKISPIPTPTQRFHKTLYLLSLLRNIHPRALLPSTTALATLIPGGREKGILHGANVVMPNLSPEKTSNKYEIYKNKLNTGSESANGLATLSKALESIGYEINKGIGNYV